MQGGETDEQLAQEVRSEYTEAVNIFVLVAEELEETGKELHQVGELLKENFNSQESLLSSLESGQKSFSKRENVEELASYLDESSESTEKLHKEAEKAKHEAETAIKEARQLEKLGQEIEKVLGESGELKKLSEAEKRLNRARKELGKAVKTAKECKSAREDIESGLNMARRTIVKASAAGIAASLTGLSGCSAAFDIKNFENNVYQGRLKYLGEMEISQGYWGAKGDSKPLPVYKAVDAEAPPTQVQALYIFDPGGKLAGLDIQKCGVSNQAFRVKVKNYEVDRYGNHPEFVHSECLDLHQGYAGTYFAMTTAVDVSS
ncbi:MAG: hypothetical protein ABEJ75_02310 [Candidatus Nanohaloarchaea archaeon]